ncbi:MAG: ABC transporter ATP-binding protein [Elusimicrobia bacterium]|nr:ABC transporter ATP-binding protein [Elusimicrobiota bacterium]
MNPSVEVSHLTIRFGEFTAVDDISFSVDPGEIFGFLGANGAGKTTTIRTLLGLLAPSSGTVKVAGLDLSRGANAVKGKVGYMSQRFTLYNDLTVSENLAFAAGLRKMTWEALERRTRELFEFIGFTRPASTPVQDLPGGIKQELALAAALLHEPEIVFLDEPTAGVAPAVRLRFWALIKKLAGSGKTVFVTTHYMDEAEQCGRIALMRAGRIIALETPQELKARAFPEPLVELERADEALLGRLRADPAALGLRPHGMRWHLALRDERAWQELEESLPPGSARRIAPSLEDVFVRLVEGRER